jgi:hypothetical protein
MFQNLFDINGLVYHEFIPLGECVTGHLHVQVLHMLRDAVRGSGETNSRQGQWFLQHDNAPSHTSLVVQQFLAEKNIQSSPNHRTLRISLRVTHSCSLLWKWASWGHVSQPLRTSIRMPWPNSFRFQKNPSAGASNNGRIDGTSVSVRKGPTLKVIR